jgi:hypothetical protein
MTNTTNNEVMVNTQTGEIVEAKKVIRENENYIVVQDANGKFARKAKFKEYSSFKPKDREEKIWLLQVMEGDEDSGFGLKDHVGSEIVVQNIITRTYDRINEDNGETEYGVLTYLITPEKKVFVTSSKTVYFSITRIMDLFGTPDSDDWVNIKIKVGKEKGQQGDIIKIKMIG